MGNSIKLRADMFYQILQRFLYDSLVLNFQIFCFSLTKKKLWEFSAMVKNHGQSWFGPSLLYLGPTIQENHNKQMLLTFQECLSFKNHHVCVVPKVQGPFIRLSRLNQMKSQVMNANNDGESSELFTQAFAVKGSNL